MRWLLPFFLLVAGWWLEWGPGHAPGVGLGDHPPRTARSPMPGSWAPPRCSASPAGGVGRALAGTLTDLFGRRARSSCSSRWRSSASSSASGSRSASCCTRSSGPPAGSGATAAASMRRVPADEDADQAAASRPTNGKPAGRTARPSPAGPSPGQTGAWGDDDASIPAAVPSRARPQTRSPRRVPDGGLGDPRSPRSGRRATRRRHRRRATRRSPSTGSSTSCRRCRSSTTSRSRSMPAATRPSMPATRRSSSRSWPASASRPGSSGATPVRW